MIQNFILYVKSKLFRPSDKKKGRASIQPETILYAIVATTLIISTFWFLRSPDLTRPRITVHDDMLSPIKQCVRDMNAIPGNQFPSVKNPDVRVPFYVFPEFLPTEMSWSECFMSVKSETHNKRLWEYYIAKQLENHPWRVHDPNKALLFIFPWGDYHTDTAGVKFTLENREQCDKLFIPVSKMIDYIAETFHKYDQLNERNTILFLGAYSRRGGWKKSITKHTEEFGDRPLWSRIPTISFTPAINRYTTDPYQKSMAVNVDSGICYPGSADSDPLFDSIDDRLNFCHSIHRRLDEDAALPTAEWKAKRHTKFQSVGKFDLRSDYLNRLVLTYAFTAAHQEGRLDRQFYEPSFILFNHQRKGADGGLEDVVVGGISDYCRAEIAKLEEAGTVEDSDGIFCGGGLDRGWRKYLTKYKTMNWEMKSESQMVLSMRGDSIGSQRSHEGLFYGSLTFHDKPLYLLGLSILPFPNLIPWRLTGYFDDNQCLKETILDYEDRFLRSYQIINGVKERREKVKLSEEEWERLELESRLAEEKMIQCVDPLPRLLETDEELVTLMRRTIQYYRDDVLFETPRSRAAENHLYEIASELPAPHLKKFNLTPEDFRPQVPASCTADTTEFLEKLRTMTSEEATNYVLSIADEDDIVGPWGRSYGM